MESDAFDKIVGVCIGRQYRCTFLVPLSVTSMLFKIRYFGNFFEIYFEQKNLKVFSNVTSRINVKLCPLQHY